MLKTGIDIIIFLIGISPLIFGGGKLIAQIIHNKKMYNFIDRTQIIVNSLVGTNQPNAFKKSTALSKSLAYAKEIGFNITEDQAEDYIEAAVLAMKQEEARYATKQELNGSAESSTTSGDTGTK